MIAKLFKTKKTKNRGNGLFAKEFIPKGTITWFECKNCKKRTPEEFKSLPKKEREWVIDHEFIDKTRLFANVCDKTILNINHSCNANILDSGKKFDIVIRDIKKGEEATYDYRVFYDPWKMRCYCGEKNCCKTLNFKHPVPKKLQQFWKTRINSALKLVNKVKQPLRKELRQESIFFPANTAAPQGLSDPKANAKYSPGMKN
jgi:hypothetical protein